MSFVEQLKVIEDDRRRELERAALARLARGGQRVHRRTLGARVRSWIRSR